MGVDVWLADLGAVAPSLDRLSADERERAGRFGNAAARRRFVASHVVLRDVLARYAAAGVELVAGAGGKPRLAQGGPAFNLSHSGELAVVAVADQAVGVDVQEVRPLRDADAVARRILAPSERGADVLVAWTRKEAVVKATGEGLRRPLAEVVVFPPAGPWWVEELAGLPAGYVGAVAGLGPPGTTSFWLAKAGL